jgi:hypothetical protein
MKAKITLEDGRTLDVEVNGEQLKQFTKDEPMTWEKLDKVSGWYVDNISNICELIGGVSNIKNKNTFPTKEHAEAALAEAQLLQLRNWYRNDWEPTIGSICYDVFPCEHGFNCIPYSFSAELADLFSFQSKEVAERFLNEQRELLEIWAKKFEV